MNNEVYCSEDCYKEEKFSRSILGTLFQSSLSSIIFGLLAFWLFFPMMIFYSYWELDSSEYKINAPYVIISTLLLPILILSHNINFLKYFRLPSKFIKKILSVNLVPYLIVLINHIYVTVFCLRIFVFHDVIGGKVKNTDIFGFDFNIAIANSLLVLSFLSIIILLNKRNHSDIKSIERIN